MSKDPFIRLNSLLAQHGLEKKETVNLHIGEPKGEPSHWVTSYIKNHMTFGSYHPPFTIPVLREAIIDYNKNVHQVSLSEKQVAAVQGTKSALAWIPQIFLSTNKISIPDLCYTTYLTAADRMGAEIEFYSAHSGLPEITDSLDYAIINTPHNPLGRIIKKEELESLVEEAQRNNVILISDECYIDIYTGKKPTSLLEADKTGTFQNLLVLNSLSKASNLPGLRSGYIAGDSNLIKKFTDTYNTVGNTLKKADQEASTIAWKDTQFIRNNRARYQRLLEKASIALNHKVPEGAFYFFVDTGRDSEEFVIDLIKKEGIKLMPGKYLDYGSEKRWDTYVRIPVAEEFAPKVMGGIANALRH